MAIMPAGRSATIPAPPGSTGCGPDSRGSALRLRSARRAPGGSAGCSSTRPAGIGSLSSSAAVTWARFRRDAKAGGTARACSTRPRT
eukprot:6183867-Pleurochrysis_carterae.AAC.2